MTLRHDTNELTVDALRVEISGTSLMGGLAGGGNVAHALETSASQATSSTRREWFGGSTRLQTR